MLTSPFSFPNFYCSLVKSCLLPSVSFFTHSQFWKIYCDLNKGSPPKVFCPSKEDTLQKLKNLILHAYNEVPFYRERMHEKGITPEEISNLDDIRLLPLTTKADIAANFPDRSTAANKVYPPWRYLSTSGTIERLTVIKDFRKRDIGRAAGLLSPKMVIGYEPGMRYMEIPPDICANICGTSDMVEPSLFKFIWDNFLARRLFDSEVISDLRGLIERQVIFRTCQLPSFGSEGLAQEDEALNAYLQQIDQYQPFVLKALPVYLYLLALHIRKHKLQPPRIGGGVMPMGGSLTPHMKQVIESAFQCTVPEDYGCAELGAIAVECGRQTGLHPLSSLFFVEVLHKGRPAEPGELGKVCITDLYNYAMPFIRYEIGDVARVLPGPCECGVSGVRLEIQGRMQDCLLTDTGELITSDQLVDEFLEMEEVLGIQIEVNEPNVLKVQVAPKQGCQVIVEKIRTKLGQLLGAKRKVLARIVPTILPEPSGKYRFVKNHLGIEKDFF